MPKIYYKKANGQATDLQWKETPDADDIEYVGDTMPDIETLHDASYITEKKWKEVRKKRDQMLRDSDHKMLSDYSITAEKKAEWIAYRDQLKNIPQRYTDPSAIIYPIKPK